MKICFLCNMSSIEIRPIVPADNETLATIIRTTLKEYGANHPGTVYYDESTDHLSDLFMTPSSSYHVAELEGKVVGGAGIFPTEGLPSDTCELVKMYLRKSARGKGLGKMLMSNCLQTAVGKGFKNVYLETMPELTDAIPMYNKFGFELLNAPLGNTGHHGCGIWMLKKLEV